MLRVLCIIGFIALLMQNRTHAILASFNDRSVLNELKDANLFTITPCMLQMLDIKGSEYILKLIINKNETIFGGLKYRAKIDAPKIHPGMVEQEMSDGFVESIKENEVLEKLISADLFTLNNETYQLLNIDGGYFVLTISIDKYTIKREALEYHARIKRGGVGRLIDSESVAGNMAEDSILIKNYAIKALFIVPYYDYIYVAAYGGNSLSIFVTPLASGNSPAILSKILKYKRLPMLHYHSSPGRWIAGLGWT